MTNRYTVIALPPGRWGLRDECTGAVVAFVSCHDEAQAREHCAQYNAAYRRWYNDHFVDALVME